MSSIRVVVMILQNQKKKKKLHVQGDGGMKDEKTDETLTEVLTDQRNRV